jgi:nicotinamidase-related amidase
MRAVVTTLPSRPNSALLVIDVQNGVVRNAHERDAVVANVGALVDKARAAGADIVWVQHHDDEPEKVIAHTNLYWQYHEAPGRTAGTVDTAGIDFSDA